MNWLTFYWRNIHWYDVLKLAPLVAVVTQLQGWWIAVGVLALLHVITVQTSALTYRLAAQGLTEDLIHAKQKIAEIFKSTGGAGPIPGADSSPDLFLLDDWEIQKSDSDEN